MTEQLLYLNEQKAIKQVEQKILYSKLNVDFLQKRKKVSFKILEIWKELSEKNFKKIGSPIEFTAILPFWGVYPLKGLDFEPLKIEWSIYLKRGWRFNPSFSYEFLTKIPLTYEKLLHFPSHSHNSAKVFESMGKLQIILKSEFVGILPDQTKEKIEEAKKYYKHLFLIKEDVKWQRESEQKVQLAVNCPLIVAEQDDETYLIDKFDCSTFEEYISKEFTQ